MPNTDFDKCPYKSGVMENLKGIHDKIDRLDRKIENFSISNKSQNENIMLNQNLTNGRVKALEMWKTFILGIWVATVFIGGLFWTVFEFIY